jgi:arylsulfatase A-like enzyme
MTRTRALIRSGGWALWSAGTAGIGMAVLNGLIEELRGPAVLGFADIPRLALWYALACGGIVLGWGAAGGLFGIARLPSEKPSPVLLGLPLYCAAWLIILGYVNLYWLPVLLSWNSLLWNMLLVSGAGGLYILGVKVFGFRLSPRGLAWISGGLVVMILGAGASGWWARRGGNLEGDAPPRPEAAPSAPNVLLIVLDAVRPDHLGCYGYPRATSPHLDRLAGESTVFLRAFAASSYTMESAPALFTSTYPSFHGVHSFSDRLSGDIPLLPQVFQQQGYRTAVFSTIRNVSRVAGFGRGLDELHGVAVDPLDASLPSHFLTRLVSAHVPLIAPVCRGLLSVSHRLFATEDRIRTEDPLVITDQITRWISQNRTRPFFVYGHYRGGHRDYTPPPPYDRMFDPDYPEAPVTIFPPGRQSFPPFTRGRPMPQRARTNLIAQYDGEIRQHDEALGNLLRFLGESGLREDTILLICAVHGEELYEHGGWGHGQSLHDELIHVPLVLHVPDLASQPRRISHLVSLVDIFPTLCSLCNIPLPDGATHMSGQDLTPWIIGTVQGPGRSYVYAELHQGGHQARALRTAEHKAIWVRFGRRQVSRWYDVRNDPGEADPILPAPGNPGEALFKRLAEVFRCARYGLLP